MGFFNCARVQTFAKSRIDQLIIDLQHDESFRVFVGCGVFEVLAISVQSRDM